MSGRVCSSRVGLKHGRTTEEAYAPPIHEPLCSVSYITRLCGVCSRRALTGMNGLGAVIPLRMVSRQRVIILVTGFFLIHTPAYGGLCKPPVVKKESPFAYMVSLTDALSYGKEALGRLDPKDQQLKDPDPLTAHYDHLLGLKLGKADFECAASQVQPYEASSNDAIQSSAQGVALVFATLAVLNDKSVAEHKALLNSLAKGKAEPGTFLEREAQLGASYDETWKLLIPAVITGTYAVVEEDPATGRMSGLALTASQRDEILRKLRGTFGAEITKGMQAGQISLVGAAAILYQVIGLQQQRPRGQ